MSEVLRFFEEHPLSGDQFHSWLSARPGLQERLKEITQAALSCCGCEPKKGGAVELVIVDKDGFARLQEERQSIEAKLAALSVLVDTLDKIFLDAEAQGHPIHEKVPAAINRVENAWRATHRQEAKEPWNPLSRSTGIANPTLTALMARATEALEQAQIAGWA